MTDMELNGILLSAGINAGKRIRSLSYEESRGKELVDVLIAYIIPDSLSMEVQKIFVEEFVNAYIKIVWWKNKNNFTEPKIQQNRPLSKL